MPTTPSRGVTLTLTTVAMVAFAANSLLARAALAHGAADPVSFTTARLGSGAAALLILSRGSAAGGSWRSALALAGYAFAFSLAYVRIPAAVGALLLFAAVQLTLIALGVAAGERPGAREWLGFLVAFGGLVALTRPGTAAPDLLGAALMLGSGAAWGIYTWRGKGSAKPLVVNAGNFLRTTPLAILALALAIALAPRVGSPGGIHLSARGLELALVSGALTSGLGYAIWYAALRGLTATRAAVVQLSVVPLAALGAVAFLGERLTVRLLVCGAAILGGIALAMGSRRRQRS